MDIPKMPQEFKSTHYKQDQYHKTQPRFWTKEEEEWILQLRKNGFTMQEIAESVDRELPSVSIKLKRLRKKDKTYNSDHVKDKHEVNNRFVQDLGAKTLLDVYCGLKSCYNSLELSITTNDIDKHANTDYHLDSLKLLCQEYLNDNTYDIVDLDPYGSAANCYDLAIQLANKGICITLGEMGHKRFKRLDYVRRYYGIETLEEFTTERLIEQIQKIGMKYKKELEVVEIREYKNVSRVWFKINKIKIIEQWES